MSFTYDFEYQFKQNKNMYTATSNYFISFFRTNLVNMAKISLSTKINIIEVSNEIGEKYHSGHAYWWWPWWLVYIVQDRASDRIE